MPQRQWLAMTPERDRRAAKAAARDDGKKHCQLAMMTLRVPADDPAAKIYQ